MLERFLRLTLPRFFGFRERLHMIFLLLMSIGTIIWELLRLFYGLHQFLVGFSCSTLVERLYGF